MQLTLHSIEMHTQIGSILAGFFTNINMQLQMQAKISAQQQKDKSSIANMAPSYSHICAYSLIILSLISA